MDTAPRGIESDCLTIEYIVAAKFSRLNRPFFSTKVHYTALSLSCFVKLFRKFLRVCKSTLSYRSNEYSPRLFRCKIG